MKSFREKQGNLTDDAYYTMQEAMITVEAESSTKRKQKLDKEVVDS